MPFIKDNSIALDPIGWETDVYPGITPKHPQAELSELAENSDILIAIFHRKLGGSGYETQSGTVDEIERALKRRETTGIAPEIVVYFREVDEDLPDDDFVEVVKYKKKLQSRGKCPYLRTDDYKDARFFQQRLTERLAVYVDKWLKEQDKTFAIKVKDYETLVTHVSQPLLNWPDTIDGKWIERPELDQLFSNLTGAIKENRYARSASLVLGDPGTGKSALLSRLAKKLIEHEIQVFSIKADMLPANITTQIDLAEKLQLSMSVEDCLRQSTMKGPVVFIVDQLDAVSEIADRKSERLNLLLNLINTATSIDGVHVVASCRVFEHKHDVRLSTINADEVTLQLPGFDDISEIIKSHGINPERLSSEVKEILRVPQHLKTFVEVMPSSEGRLDAVSSIQELYEELWRQKIESASDSIKRKEFIGKLTKWMSEEEDLWVPLVIADGYHDIVDELAAEHLLVKEGNRVGFKHQTFFDFTLARGFVSGESLSRYVLDRQDGLFVRPVLLSTLDYLRATSRKRYHKELSELWNNPSLRNHLRILLDEKVASQRKPDEVEQGLVMPILMNENLSDKQTARLLVSMAGSPGWFELIHSSVLPDLMSLPVEDAWPCITLLSSSWPFAHDRVLELIETYLMPYKEKDALTLAILQAIDKWDESSVNTLCHITRRTYNYNVRWLADDISQNAPDLAPRVVRADVERRMELAMQEDSTAPGLPQITEDSNENEVVSHMLYEKNKELKKVFELGTEWHELSNIAESAPLSFLENIWPMFLNALSYLLREPNPLINSYQHDTISPHLDGRHSVYDGQLTVVIDTAIITLAKTDQDAFLEFFKENINSPSHLVHRFLCRGLCNIAASKHRIVKEYLTGDQRRLVIGDFEDAHKESKMLIQKIMPFLDDVGRKEIEDAVLSFSYYMKDKDEWSAEQKQDRRKWAREHRLRLLRSIPESAISLKARRIRDEEERAFPCTLDWDCRIGECECIGSPISCDRMAKANDDDLLQVFDELDDSTEWDHPRYRMKGGTIQASRELETLAEKEPGRVALLILKFKPGKQEIAAGHAICGLSKSDFPPDKLITLIHDMNKKGFNTESFYSDASRALETIARKIHGLPNETIKLLEEWYFSSPEPAFKDVEEDKNNDNSILWDHGFITLGGGRAKIIDTIAKGYLWRKTPDLAGWTNTILSISEVENHIDVWKLIVLEMPYLFNGDKKTATETFEIVNAKLSQIGYSREWVMAVARVLSFVTDKDVARSWLTSIKDSEWKLNKRAFGELIVLWNCYYQDDKWSKDLIEEQLEKKDAEVCLGHAYAARNLFSNVRYRDICTEIMIKLADSPDERIQRAIAHVFGYGDPLPLNKSMKKLIEAILPNDALLLKAAEALIEGIEPSTTAAPDLVNKICHRLLDASGNQIHNIASSLALLAEPLVRISMTLHRMDSHRLVGLALFERLMDNNVGAARQALYLLDRRPITDGVTLRRPRPRRARRKLKQ